MGSATAARGVLGATDDEPLTPAEVAQPYWDPRELIGFTERSTTTLSTLQAKRERTPERGYATDEGEVHRAGIDPERGQDPAPAQINTEGKVTGEGRITVDQQGKSVRRKTFRSPGTSVASPWASARRA